MVNIHLQCRRPGFDPWVRKTPLVKEMATCSSILPGESHGQRSLVSELQPMGLKRVGHD